MSSDVTVNLTPAIRVHLDEIFHSVSCRLTVYLTGGLNDCHVDDAVQEENYHLNYNVNGDLNCVLFKYEFCLRCFS